MMLVIDNGSYLAGVGDDVKHHDINQTGPTRKAESAHAGDPEGAAAIDSSKPVTRKTWRDAAARQDEAETISAEILSSRDSQRTWP